MEKLSSWRVDDLEILPGETKEFLFQTSNPNMFFIQNPNNVVLKISLSKMPTSQNYEFLIEKNSSLTFGRPIPSKKITILNDSSISVSIKMFSVNAPFDMSVNKNLSLNLVGAEIHTDGEVKAFSNGVQLPPGNNKIGRVGLADEEKNLLSQIAGYSSEEKNLLSQIVGYSSLLSSVDDDERNAENITKSINLNSQNVIKYLNDNFTFLKNLLSENQSDNMNLLNKIIRKELKYEYCLAGCSDYSEYNLSSMIDNNDYSLLPNSYEVTVTNDYNTTNLWFTTKSKMIIYDNSDKKIGEITFANRGGFIFVMQNVYDGNTFIEALNPVQINYSSHDNVNGLNSETGVSTFKSLINPATNSPYISASWLYFNLDITCYKIFLMSPTDNEYPSVYYPSRKSSQVDTGLIVDIYDKNSKMVSSLETISNTLLNIYSILSNSKTTLTNGCGFKIVDKTADEMTEEEI